MNKKLYGNEHGHKNTIYRNKEEIRMAIIFTYTEISAVTHSL